MKEHKVYRPSFRAGELPAPTDIQPWARMIEEPPGGKNENGANGPWTVLWSHKWLLASCSALCAIVALGASLLQTPVYKAQTSLEIEDLNNRFLQMDEVDPVARGGNSDSFLATQVDMLTSSTLLGKVVTRLNLDKPYRDSEPEEGFFDRLRESFGLRKTPQESPKESAIADARSNLTINAMRGSSRVVTIEYTSTDPHLAADFPNTLAQEFIDQGIQLRMQSAHRLNAWLVQELAQSQRRLQESEDALQAYGKSAGLLFTDDKNSVAQTKLKQLQDELSRAQADRMGKQSTYELMKNASPDALAQMVGNRSFQEYQLRLTDLRRQLADVETNYTPNHYKVRQVLAQIAEVEAALKESQDATINRVSNDYLSAQRHESLLQQAYSQQEKLVSAQDAKASRYNMLKNEVDTNRQVYDTMLQRVKGVNLASAMRASNVAVFDPAEAPSVPFKPKPGLNTSIGLISGLLLSAIYVFLRDRWDRSLRLPGEVASYLRVPELGAVPKVNMKALAAAAGGQLSPRNGELQISGRNGVEYAMIQDHLRMGGRQIADSFRAILTSIMLAAKGRSSNVIVLTSPSAQEGKTTVATNLAAALAVVGKKVLLVDADLRKPRLHEIFGLRNDHGFSDLLLEATQSQSESGHGCSAYIQLTEVPRLSVLTAGRKRTSASNVLYGPLLAEILPRLRHGFDIVLVDTAPVLPVSDARLLGLNADGVVLVCRAGATHRERAKIAIERLLSDGAHVIGTILNDFDPRMASYHNSYYDHSYSWSQTDTDHTVN